jgi:energy-coupling factor transport system substrate-specific component
MTDHAAVLDRRTDLPATGRPGSWRVVDLVTAAMIAVAFGVVFWGYDTLVYPAIGLATAALPPLAELSLGVWLLPAVVGGLIVRRPGAALFTEFVAANVELLLGNQWGIGVLASGLLQGIGVELVFLLTRWRRFGPGVAVAGGAVSAIAEIVAYEWWSYVPTYAWPAKLLYLLAGVVSGAVVAGLLGWLLVRGLARTGALAAFPPGREARTARRAVS